MKYLYKLMFLFSIAFFIQSCDEEGYTDSISDPVNAENLPWQALTNLSIYAEEEMGNFIWLKDLLSFEEYWGNDTVVLNIELDSNQDLTFFTNVEFYLTAQELNGYNFQPPYNTQGKLLANVPITSFDEATKSYQLSISVDNVVALFGDDFQNDRSENPLLEGDIFEIHYKLIHDSDDYLDSRESSGIDTRYGFSVQYKDFAPPVWEGTFNYEYTDATGNAEYYGGIQVGETGTIDITHLGDQVYSLPNLGMSYYYTRSGTLTFDFLSGLVEIEGSYEEKWNITKVDGPTVYIDMEYRYSAGYDEYWSFSLTRTDGNDWPTNLYTN